MHPGAAKLNLLSICRSVDQEQGNTQDSEVKPESEDRKQEKKCKSETENEAEEASTCPSKLAAESDCVDKTDEDSKPSAKLEVNGGDSSAKSPSQDEASPKTPPGPPAPDPEHSEPVKVEIKEEKDPEDDLNTKCSNTSTKSEEGDDPYSFADDDHKASADAEVKSDVAGEDLDEEGEILDEDLVSSLDDRQVQDWSVV